MPNKTLVVCGIGLVVLGIIFPMRFAWRVPISRAQPVGQQLASFEAAETWTGGTVETLLVHEGAQAHSVSVAANEVGFFERSTAASVGAGDWTLSAWVQVDEPANLGRATVYFRTGNATENKKALWSFTGLQSGWNKVTMRSADIFSPYWFASKFSWANVDGIGVKVEANANGPITFVIDDIRIDPTSGADTVAPIIRPMTVTDITDHSAVVRWRTNESTSALLECGSSTTYGTTVFSQSTPQTSFAASVEIPNSVPTHCRLTSTDTSGNISRSGDVSIRTRGQVINSETTTFPLGLWGINTLDDLDVAASMGATAAVNFYLETCLASLTDQQAYLDRSVSHGMKAVLGTFCDPIDLGWLSNRVNALKNHAGLYGWLTYDEPENRNPPYNDLKSVYDTIQTNDGQHPVMVTSYSLGPIYTYNGTYSVGLADPYVIPFGTMTDLASKWTLASLTQVPWHSVVQAYSMDIDLWPGLGAGASRLPTQEEITALSVYAVNNGAKGLWLFSYGYLTDTPGQEWKMAELGFVVNELRDFLPIFAAPTAQGLTVVKNGVQALSTSTRRLDGADYVVSVNPTTSTLNGTLTLNLGAQPLVRELKSGQTVSTNNGVLNISYAPNEVKIFQITYPDTTSPDTVTDLRSASNP